MSKMKNIFVLPQHQNLPCPQIQDTWLALCEDHIRASCLQSIHTDHCAISDLLCTTLNLAFRSLRTDPNFAFHSDPRAPHRGSRTSFLPCATVKEGFLLDTFAVVGLVRYVNWLRCVTSEHTWTNCASCYSSSHHVHLTSFVRNLLLRSHDGVQKQSIPSNTLGPTLRRLTRLLGTMSDSVHLLRSFAVVKVSDGAVATSRRLFLRLSP